MGRFFGRRPDPTERIARAAAKHLRPGERVVAGIHVQKPGTHGAEMTGAASGAAVGALDAPISFDREESADHRGWVVQAPTVGIDPSMARKAVWMSLVLTDDRLVLLRKSRLTRRVLGPVAAWPLSEVERIDVPRSRQELTVHVGDGAALRLELPLAHKFLPDVYRELPARLVEVQRRSG